LIEFCPLEDSDPALELSPMLRAARHLRDYISQQGAIGLTPSKAFKRSFVHWAAKAFDWPGYSEADLFLVKKVLNETDFPPLGDLHDLLIRLKIGRHYKQEFRLTKAGKKLIGHPGQIFGIITPYYLFETDHSLFSRWQEPVLGNWDIFLNVINVEAEGGISGGHLRQCLFGEVEADTAFDPVMGMLWSQVLRPLCWTGLLKEHSDEDFQHFENRVYEKTPLWNAALKLSTDIHFKQTIH